MNKDKTTRTFYRNTYQILETAPSREVSSERLVSHLPISTDTHPFPRLIRSIVGPRKKGVLGFSRNVWVSVDRNKHSFKFRLYSRVMVIYLIPIRVRKFRVTGNFTFIMIASTHVIFVHSSLIPLPYPDPTYLGEN